MENQNNERLILKTKAFITDLLAGVNTEDSIQDIIGYIMRQTGIFTHAESVCIYEAGTGMENVEKVYQWEAENTDAKDVSDKPVPKKDIADWFSVLKQKKLVIVPDRETVRDTDPVKYDLMMNQGVRKLLLIPVYAKEHLLACMGLVNPDFTAFAVPDSTFLFLGQQIGAVYRRERMNHKYQLFMDGIRSSNLSEFFVDLKTKRYEAFRITRVLSNMIPEEGDWDWLRQFYASIIKPEYREELLRRSEREYMETLLRTEKSTYTIDIERDVAGINNWFRLEFSVVSFDGEGHLERFVLLVKDITQMKQEEEEHRQMISALNSIYNVSAMIDLADRKVQPMKLSQAALKFIPDEQMPAQTMIDAFCSRMVQKDYEESIREFMNPDTMQQRLENTNILTCEYQGTQIEWGRINLAPAKRNPDGTLKKVVLAIQDVSEQKRREEQMQYKIEHDELTGTLNRTAFNRVTKQMESSAVPFGLVLMDIDKFKSINDTYGHDVGDEVLIRLITVLNEKMRTSDMIFRLGGDEFAIVMSRLTLSQADLVKNIVDAVNVTTTAGTNELPAFTVSAGVTFSKEGYNERIYRNADKALYRTKETTRRGCTVYEEMN